MNVEQTTHVKARMLKVHRARGDRPNFVPNRLP
jgi:hypothetical protein